MKSLRANKNSDKERDTRRENGGHRPRNLNQEKSSVSPITALGKPEHAVPSPRCRNQDLTAWRHRAAAGRMSIPVFPAVRRMSCIPQDKTEEKKNLQANYRKMLTLPLGPSLTLQLTKASAGSNYLASPELPSTRWHLFAMHVGGDRQASSPEAQALKLRIFELNEQARHLRGFLRLRFRLGCQKLANPSLKRKRRKVTD